MKSKAIRFYQNGGPQVLKLEDVEIPVPLENEMLIKVRAVGLNYIDTYYRTGLYQTTLPSGLGSEGAGVVESVGKNVTYFKPGDRVVWPQGKLGAYAEYHVVEEKNAVILPPEISFEEGAAMMLKGLTVQYLLRQIWTLRENDTVLFHAAAGGVGSIACQWAKHLGLKLIGTVGTDEKAKLAQEFGAWKTINYSKENVFERVLEFTDGKKVPVVFDSVGKATWETSLDCLSPRGLMVSFGNASGPVTGVNLSDLARRGSLYVTRPVLRSFIDTHEKLLMASDELFELVKKKVIRISVSNKYKLSEIHKAHADLEERKTTGLSILLID